MDYKGPALLYWMTVPVFLTSIFSYFYIRYHEKYLGLWSLSWLILMIRSVINVWLFKSGKPEIVFTVDHLGAIGGGLPLVLGTFSFLNRKTPNILLAGFLLSFTWFLGGQLLNFNFVLLSAPIWIFVGIAHIWTGVMLIKCKRIKHVAYLIAGWAFILWGIQKVSYPVLRTIDPVVAWGYFLGGLLFFILSASLLLIYMEEIKTELSKSEQKYRSLVKNIPDVVWTSDHSGKIIYSSSMFFDKFNLDYYKNDLVGNGHKFHNVHPDDIECVKERWSEFINNKQAFDVDYRIKNRYGTWVWLHDKAISTYKDDGTVYADGITSDVTARKAAEKEKEHLIEQLNEKISQIKTLKGLLPICASCKKIRDDEGYWNQIEGYIQKNSNARFSHGICPDCYKRLYPDLHYPVKDGRNEGTTD